MLLWRRGFTYSHTTCALFWLVLRPRSFCKNVLLMLRPWTFRVIEYYVIVLVQVKVAPLNYVAATHTHMKASLQPMCQVCDVWLLPQHTHVYQWRQVYVAAMHTPPMTVFVYDAATYTSSNVWCVLRQQSHIASLCFFGDYSSRVLVCFWLLLHYLLTYITLLLSILLHSSFTNINPR
mgnify:CR=1 FL=1